MNSGGFLLVIAVFTAAAILDSTAQQNEDTCGACNCEFNNIRVLSDVIDAKIDGRLNTLESRVNNSIDRLNSSLTGLASIIAGQPVLKIMYIGLGGSGTRRTVRFQMRDPATWALLTPRTDLTIANTNNAYTSSNNIIAYRPNYNDRHRSNLGALFVNLQSLFPCLNGANIHPACSIFTSEEDGFRGAKPIIQAADIGNNFRIFSSNSNFETFGFGVAGCSTFDGACVSTLEVALICLFPRNRCG